MLTAGLDRKQVADLHSRAHNQKTASKVPLYCTNSHGKSTSKLH